MEASHTGSGVTIGIPTYKRPEKLRRLLTSLLPSLETMSARVLVCDNACAPETEQIVSEFRKSWPDTVYEPVPARGLSAVRNRIIALFLADDRKPRWLAMLDDDLAVGPDWLARMIATGQGCDADAVGAPFASTAEPSGFIVSQSIFIKRPRRPTGPTRRLGATGNILLSRTLLERMAGPHFNEAYGLSGGEDYDFFRRIEQAGARFAWCDEAFADESVDFDRLTSRAVLGRYYSTGNYMALIDRELDGAAISWRRHGVGLIKASGLSLLSALRFNRTELLRGVFGVLFNVGGLAGLAGLRTHRYR